MRFSNLSWSKNQLSALLLVVIMLASLGFSGCSKEKEATDDVPKLHASLAVDCIMAYETDPEKVDATAKGGIILKEKEFSLEEGKTTVMDLLKASKLTYDDSAGYVSEIDGVKEKEFGDQSGWLFAVNGKTPSVGAGEYVLSEGDLVEFRYSLNWGEDLGFEFE